MLALNSRQDLPFIHLFGANDLSYLIPPELAPELAPPPRDQRHKVDWAMNARGFYFKNHYSRQWVTADRILSLPSVDGVDWNHRTEQGRRRRAKRVEKSALENEAWNKGEDRFEKSAWINVLNRMARDSVLQM